MGKISEQKANFSILKKVKVKIWQKDIYENFQNLQLLDKASRNLAESVKKSYNLQ